MLRTILLAALLTLAMAAAAAPTKDGDLARLAKQLDTLQADIAKGQRFRHVDNETQDELRTLSERMRETIAPVSDFDQLDAAAQSSLMADQKALSALLDRVDLDRPKCRPEKRTGSNVRQVVCRTKREEDMLRDEQRLQLRKPMGCSGVNCGRE